MAPSPTTVPPRPAPAWLLRARALLHERCRGPVELRDIAADVGVHPVHLSRAFHRAFGVTMSAELRRLRLEHARVALLRTGDSLSRVALAHGFADHAHFTRAFKRHVGLTPCEYRRAGRLDAARRAR